MIGKQFCRRAQEFTGRRCLSGADVESPFSRRGRLQREINRSANIADVDRVVQLIAPLRYYPFVTATRLLDELTVKRQRTMTRFFTRAIDRNKSQRNKFDT